MGGAGRLSGGLRLVGSCGVDFIDVLLKLLATDEELLLLILIVPPALTVWGGGGRERECMGESEDRNRKEKSNTDKGKRKRGSTSKTHVKASCCKKYMYHSLVLHFDSNWCGLVLRAYITTGFWSWMVTSCSLSTACCATSSLSNSIRA